MVVHYAIDSDDHTDIHGFYDNQTIAELAALNLNKNAFLRKFEVAEYELNVRNHNVYRKQCPSSNAAKEDS